MQLRLGVDPGALITDHGLDRGTLAPDFAALDADTGMFKRLSDFPRLPRLLVFVTPSCIACQRLIPHLNEVAATRAAEVDFLVICTGDLASCRDFRYGKDLKVPMLVDDSGKVSRTYQANVSPFTYLIGEDGRVLIRGVANDWRDLESLLQEEGTLEAGTTMVLTESSEPITDLIRESEG